MSRHRDVRNLDYDEEYDEACDANVYGHSMDDSEYGMSPGMEQYLYSRSRDNTHGFGLYFPTGADIKEEEETVDGLKNKQDRSRHDSTSRYEKPPLSPEDEVRLASVLDELRNILGDQFSEGELTETVIGNNFHLEAALNALLNRSASASSVARTPTSPPPRFPQPRPPAPQSSSTGLATSSVSVPGSGGLKGTSEPLPQREKRPRKRDNTTPPTEGIRQLALTHNNHTHVPSAHKDLSAAPAAAAAATPVVVGQKTAGTPRVIRGFDVVDTEDGLGGTQEASQSASSMDQESANKRSRSSTPLQPTSQERDATAAATAAATPTAAKAPAKIRDKPVDVVEEYRQQRGGEQGLLNLVVVGHVDAGKSTLMGHLLYLRGTVAQRTMHKYEQESRKLGKQSFMYAWVLDDTEEERSRGITVDVAQRVFTTGHRTVTLLDAPGHRDFIPNMITGAARADAAVLAVDASTGAFEAGFDSGGQTREHALLVRSLGVSQLVVAINKLDAADWSEERMKEVRHSLRQFLKGVGYKDLDVTYVPCSGLTGENLVKRTPGGPLDTWYSGPTLLEAIDALKVPERGVEKPVRMCICDVYKGQGSHMCVSGRLDAGYLQAGDRVLLMPQGDLLGVKAVQTDTQTDSNTGVAFAGDHVTLTLSGVDPSALHIGDFLCDPAAPVPLATRVQARIVVFNIVVPLIKGAQLDFHYQSVTEPASIRKLVTQLHKTTGQTLKTRPRALPKNSAALVELEFSRPLCLELFRDFREMGRFMLRAGGTTVAAGLVTKVLA